MQRQISQHSNYHRRSCCEQCTKNFVTSNTLPTVLKLKRKIYLCTPIFIDSSNIYIPSLLLVETPPSRCTLYMCLWRSGCVMDSHATTQGSILIGDGVKTELYVLRKGQYMRVPSLNDIAVDGT